MPLDRFSEMGTMTYPEMDMDIERSFEFETGEDQIEFSEQAETVEVRECEPQSEETSEVSLEQAIKETLSQQKGGNPEDWEKGKYGGEAYFDGRELLKSDRTSSLTKEAEAYAEQSGTTQWLEEHRMFLQHIQERAGEAFIFSDHTSPDGIMHVSIGVHLGEGRVLIVEYERDALQMDDKDGDEETREGMSFDEADGAEMLETNKEVVIDVGDDADKQEERIAVTEVEEDAAESEAAPDPSEEIVRVVTEERSIEQTVQQESKTVERTISIEEGIAQLPDTAEEVVTEIGNELGREQAIAVSVDIEEAPAPVESGIRLIEVVKDELPTREAAHDNSVASEQVEAVIQIEEASEELEVPSEIKIEAGKEEITSAAEPLVTEEAAEVRVVVQEASVTPEVAVGDEAEIKQEIEIEIEIDIELQEDEQERSPEQQEQKQESEVAQTESTKHVEAKVTESSEVDEKGEQVEARQETPVEEIRADEADPITEALNELFAEVETQMEVPQEEAQKSSAERMVERSEVPEQEEVVQAEQFTSRGLSPELAFMMGLRSSRSARPAGTLVVNDNESDSPRSVERSRDGITLMAA